MSCLIQCGEHFNALSRTGATVTSSPSADALFPATALYDRAPGTIFKFGSSGAGSTVTADLTDGLGGVGGLNSWSGGSPVGWTEANTGGGTVTENTVDKDEGTSSATLTAAAGSTASISIDVTVRTGWYYQVRELTYSPSLGTLNLTIQDLKTGKHWNNSAWQAGVSNLLIAGDPVGFEASTHTLRVEGYSVIRSETTVLRIKYTHPGSGAGDAVNLDSVSILPGIDFVSIHGHNIDPIITLTLISAIDSVFATSVTEATLTPQVGAFYGLLPAKIYRRYWKLNFAGTQSTATGAAWLGEWVLSQQFALSKGPAYPVRLRFRSPQIRGGLLHGGGFAYGTARLPTIGVGLDFKHEESHFTEWFHEVFMRCKDGTPMVVVPDTNDALGITYGRMADAYDVSRVLTTFRQLGAIDIEPLPLPMIVS